MSEQRVKTQKDLGELLIRMGEALLNDKDADKDWKQAVAVWPGLDMLSPNNSDTYTEYQPVIEVRLYLQSSVEWHDAAGKMAALIGKDMQNKDVDDVWKWGPAPAIRTEASNPKVLTVAEADQLIRNTFNGTEGPL